MNRLLALPLLYQRFIAVFILVAGIFLTFTVIIQPIIDYQSRRGSKHHLQYEKLQRLKKLSAQAPHIQDNIEQLLLDHRFTNGLLPPSSAAQASAAVQARVRKCVQQAGGEVRTISTTPARPFGSLTQIGISVTATLNLKEFDRLLAQLESGQPHLFIESIDIQAQSLDRRRAADNSDALTDLIVRFEVVGLARVGELS